MPFLNNLRIGHRLKIAFSIVLSLLMGMALVGLEGISKTHDTAEGIYANSLVPLVELGKVDYLIQRNRVLVMDMLLNTDPANIKKRNDERIKNSAVIDESLAKYKSTQLSDREKEMLPQFESALSTYRTQGIVALSNAMVAGSAEEGMRIYKEKVSPLTPSVAKGLSDLIKGQVELAKAQLDKGKTTEKSAINLTIALALAAIALGVVLAWSISNSITQPINHAMRFSQEVANGNLTTALTSGSRDEIGMLLTAL